MEFLKTLQVGEKSFEMRRRRRRIIIIIIIRNGGLISA
jgi:hypothetical protein